MKTKLRWEEHEKRAQLLPQKRISFESFLVGFISGKGEFSSDFGCYSRRSWTSTDYCLYYMLTGTRKSTSWLLQCVVEGRSFNVSAKASRSRKRCCFLETPQLFKSHSHRHTRCARSSSAVLFTNFKRVKVRARAFVNERRIYYSTHPLETTDIRWFLFDWWTCKAHFLIRLLLTIR